MVRTAHAGCTAAVITPNRADRGARWQQDDTARVMQGLCSAHTQVLYLKLSRNFGKKYALTAGLDAVRGEVVVMMDADDQHATSLLPLML